ncbi:MAG: OsmC family protein [Alphaproteobacteria bacterium]|nr:OsmC family protein [Alphaproteobacteria bacterium SS10]
MKRLSQKFEFTGALGDTLAGLLELPSGKRRGVAIFAHCFTCSKDSHAAARVSRALAEQGVAVLRFDFTGLGSSSGDFSNTNFSSNVEDLLAAAAALEDQLSAPTLLIGHSLGGAAVLMAAGKLPSLKGVVTMGAPSDVDHVKYNFKADLDTIERDGVAEVDLVGRKFTIRKQFLEDIKSQDLLSAVAALPIPTAFLHAPGDEIVEYRHAEALFGAASHPKSIMSLDDADHLLNKRVGSSRAADLIAGWVNGYLDAPAASDDGTQAHDPADQVSMVETGDSKFALAVKSGSHDLVADEPASVGGKDLGPDPFSYLMISLGACTVMTMRMYADHKGWPAGNLGVGLTYERRTDEETGEKSHVFERRLTVDGALDQDQRERMMEIANKCPVHRVLTEDRPEIVTLLAD